MPSLYRPEAGILNSLLHHQSDEFPEWLHKNLKLNLKSDDHVAHFKHKVEMINLISLCQFENRYFFIMCKGMNINMCLEQGLTYNRPSTNIFKRTYPRMPIALAW